MGTSRVVNWWEEWQLRILVLASLGIQYLLAIFAAGRRFHVPRWYRFLMWLCYLGSDAVAIYALATLFNRQRKQDYKFAEGSRDLEVLWAPILLMHLGGQVFITAYNLEDNELWMRHIVTAISQITVAIYVFCKSWSPSADRRLLNTSILLFTLGIAKCIEKTLSLMGASFKSLASDSSSAQRTSTEDKEKDLKDYVLKAKAFILAPKRSRPHAHQVDMSMKKFAVPDKLFTDTAYPYSDRIIILKSFFVLEHHEAYGSLRCGLSNIFTLLYTKTDVINNTKDTSKGSGHCYFSIWVGTVVLSITAISLFHKSHKQSYSMSDVIVSLVLLYGTFSLDLFSFFAVHALFEHFKNADGYRDIIAQHSLICFLSRDKRGSRFIEPSNTAKLITCMVLEYVTTGWKKHIIDAQSYLKFNDRRGHWKLKSEGFDELGWSLEKPFDESVLIWHIATDFCFHIANADKSSSKHTLICRQISNYMMHLLFANPEMLMMGSRRNLFRTACEQLKNILAGEGKSLNEFKLGQKIIEKVKDKKADSSFIHDAWVLAQGLKNQANEKLMWEVIQGVWLEMLCFSASRCRGYLHARSLGSGVEFLSYVWLLLAHMGMETLLERLQRTQKWELSKTNMKHPHGEEDAATPSAHQDTELLKKEENDVGPSDFQVSKRHGEEEIPDTPSASQGEEIVPALDEIVVSS